MRNTILLVDEKKSNREILAEVLENDYEILEADSGESAISMVEQVKDEIAAILLNVTMANLDGTEILEKMAQQDWFSRIPVAALSDEDSIRLEKKCYQLGVSEFIRKPFDNYVMLTRIQNIIQLRLGRAELEEKIQHQSEVMNKQYKLLTMQAGEIQKNTSSVIDILGTVVEYRNLENGEHIRSVKHYTEILARRMMKDYPEYRLDEKTVNTIVSASALHDIGKIAIPESVLLKPGKLTSEEYEYMKSHTLRGAEILEQIKDVWDEDFTKTAYDICRNHHERYDGNGYPDGLVGDDIPLSAQLVSLADVYDALVNERVYKEAYTKEQAFQMIIVGECGMFSPKLLECFRNTRKEFEERADSSKEIEGKY